MTRIVHLNGALVPETDARISPFDRGLLLGDGVFETMRAYEGRPFGLDAHLDRLARSCKATRLPFPGDLAARIRDVLAANALLDAAVRVTITRGPGGRGASPEGAGPATVLITAVPVAVPAETYERGVRLATARRLRMAADSLDPGIKSINYLVNVLARAEAEEAGADDALFVDDEGFVVEASQANVFAVFGDRLATPSLASGCLPGATRTVVLALAAWRGLACEETPILREDLFEASEVFLTGSVSELVPVVALDGIPMGDGRPGPLTRDLLARYRALARG